MVLRLGFHIAFILFFSLSLIAGNSGYRQITTRNGLTQNDVLCIYQDSRGFIWFGTNDGLNRYDGHEFKIYRRSENELSSGLIRGIVEDLNNNLWIATVDNGINRLNLETGRIDHFFQKGEDGKNLLSNEINDIACDHNGIIYYSTDSGVGKIIENKDGIHIINFIDDRTFTNFYQGAKIYIDTENKLWIMAGKSLFSYENDDLKLHFSLSAGLFREMTEFQGRIIFCTNLGVFYINKNDKVPETYSPKYFSNIQNNDFMIDDNQDLWLGTNSGIYKYKYHSGVSDYKLDQVFESNKTSTVGSVKVLSFYKDRTGIMYVGTNGTGVLKFNPFEKKIRHYELKEGTEKNKIRAIFQDSKGNIYIGKEEGKLLVLSSDKSIEDEARLVSNRISTIADKINQPVFAINEVHDKIGNKLVIAGSDFEYPILNLTAEKFDLPDFKARIFSITQGENGLIWFGTYGNGLVRFDPSGRLPLRSFTTDLANGSLLSNIIRSLCFDSNNRLWIGTAKGINVLLNSEQEKDFPDFISITNDPEKPSSLSYNYILPIFESRKGEVWIGTMGGGLNRLIKFDNKGLADFEHFTTEEGLPNNVIKSILEDDFDNLWISTNRGLCRFNPEERSFDNFDINDGLQDLEFSELAAFKLHDGEMLFGGVNGINAFYPNEIVKDTTSARPVFISLNVLNKEVRVNEVTRNRIMLKKDINEVGNLNLKYSENSFSVRFRSLHYGHPEKNSCMYKLKGFDNDWIFASSGEVAKYTNLKPGSYTLQLKAANSDGIWSDEIKNLKILVSPPFLLTWPMKAIYGVLVVLIFLFFRKYTIITANRKHELIIKELEKQKDKEINHIKLQFFTNISHEFKTPLTLIINPLEQLIKSDKLPSDVILRNHHSLIYRNARLLLRLINQLMDFRKIEQGKMNIKVSQNDLKVFLSEVYEAFSSLAALKKIKFQFVSHTFNPMIWVDIDKLEKVVYNILSNAFKFTPEGGTINLELVDDNSEFFTIIISDSGIGIPDEAQQKVFERFYQVSNRDIITSQGTGIGLPFSKSLIELMHGEMEFKSKVGEGTSFFIKLPKSKLVFEDKDFVEEEEAVIARRSDYFIDEINIDKKPDIHFNDNKDLCTLLLVEDNNDLRQYLRDFFSSNYNIIEALDGQEGFDKCMEYFPDLVITDISMPGMDGITMTQKLKNSPETSHIPVIMLTAQASEDQQKAGFDTGADMFLSKPFNVEVLSVQVYSLLKNRQLLRAKYREKITVVPSEISPSMKDEKFINNLLKIIEKNMTDPEFSVHKLALECGFSQTSLNKKLLALTGHKAKIFIRSIRLKRAAQLLKQGDLSISEIAYSLGFNDLQYFRKCFILEFGCLPSDYVNSLN